MIFKQQSKLLYASQSNIEQDDHIILLQEYNGFSNRSHPQLNEIQLRQALGKTNVEHGLTLSWVQISTQYGGDGKVISGWMPSSKK